ncbi:UDP-N-acetylmuramoyl-tripeptide--D-alanyl-D-alanine ligase [Rossellomorea aquimaris]|uniref:UDP-N-acetylmuramoyl-tripeptide--D-alanyl-D- alanine ligase n=1 Tax=Rossellomorea aquimaris TaxID=189382 RepID=UPI0007D093DF|nr:UDP-N-acetylmuramoyl-tripeptide--D-alanyl-D-alanine ligase [Rossellomorea aquimaris]
MKPLHLKKIIEVVEGELVFGTDDIYVEDAIIYHLHRLKQKNSLLFLDRRKEFQFEDVKSYEPVVIITDARSMKEEYKNALAVVEVKNIRTAVLTFARFYRGLFQIPIIAITGTNGKTTTKDMVAHILTQYYSVQGTIRSRNAPKKSFQYLMGIDDDTDVGVFETGLGAPGNLRYHCDIFQPTIGIITNIGVFHLDKCKTLENYIQAKGEIIDGLNNKGTLLLNSDDENIATLSLENYRGKVLYFGKKKTANLRASNIVIHDDGTQFTLTNNQKKYQVHLPCLGEHQVYNAMAAIGAAVEAGVQIRYAIKALETFNVLERHLQILKGIKDSTVIDDSWSLTPDALKAALKVLQSISNGRRKIALVGDIGRLGEHTEKYHREVGDMIAEQNIDVLLTFGHAALNMAKQVREQNKNIRVFSYVDVEEVYIKVRALLDSESILLFKCSNTDSELVKIKNRLIDSQ